MSCEIAVSRTPFALRAAVVRGGRLDDLEIELPGRPSRRGAVLLTRVSRVLPAMQAAFLEVGDPRAAFLYAGDLRDPEAGDPAPGDGEDLSPIRKQMSVRCPLDQVLQGGQSLLAQVRKDPIGKKGLRMGTFFSLPGALCIHLPGVKHVGVSRRITDDAERDRLRDAFEPLTVACGGGFIVRTAAQGISEGELQAEGERLIAAWSGVVKASAGAKTGAVLWSDGPLPVRILREYAGDRVDRILVDDPADLGPLKEAAAQLPKSLRPQVSLYKGRSRLFTHLGVDKQIAEAANPRVPMKSGAVLVIQQTEALVSVDVNSGSFTGSGTRLADTALQVNLEAAPEVFRQLRIRGLGGLVVMDFIDMDAPGHQEKLMAALEAEIARDREKNRVLGISEFGLVEMTRRRTGASLHHLLNDACPSCKGSGLVPGILPAAERLWQEVDARLAGSGAHAASVRVHPDLARFIVEHRDAWTALETQHRAQVLFDQDEGLGRTAWVIDVS